MGRVYEVRGVRECGVLSSDHGRKAYQLTDRIQRPNQAVVPKKQSFQQHEAAQGLQSATQLVVSQFQMGEVDQVPGQRAGGGDSWAGLAIKKK